MNKFCISPWIHVNILPDGGVTPCCEFNRVDKNNQIKNDIGFFEKTNILPCFGSLHKNSLKEIWNNQKFKDFRLDMINGNESNGCINCYRDEINGKLSYRQILNDKFKHHFDKVQLTENDGTFEYLNLIYWDFRFDNNCNFKCRMCGPELSSSWVNEVKKNFDIDYSVPKLNFDQHLEDIDPLLDIVEEIYFAGGEPLISEEHYKILKKLIKHKKYHIPINYNTNFSILTYKNIHIFDIWKKFKNVNVNISVDGIGDRGELIRNGFKWNDFVSNVIDLKEKAHCVKFIITATVQALNCLHIFDLHKELFSLGIIDNVDDFTFSYVLEPNFLSISIIPDDLRKEVCNKTVEHIKNFLIPNNSTTSIENFNSLINFVNNENKQYLLPKFLKYTDALDQIRNENTKLIFPEISMLWE